MKWSREGKLLTSQDDSRITTSGEEHTYCLRIRHAAGSDGGEYTISAANTAGKFSHAFLVEVVAELVSLDKGLGGEEVKGEE